MTPEPAPALDPSPPRHSRRLRRFGLGALIVCAAVFLLRLHFLGTLVVGNSMLPTFAPGDFLLVDKAAYRHAEPRRGDLVVARLRGDLIVKRVVALPGEWVEVKLGRLFLAGTEFPEDHPLLPGELSIGPGRMMEDRFAILGDNRSLPVWMAVFAVVSKEQIVGKVVQRVHWPGALRADAVALLAL